MLAYVAVTLLAAAPPAQEFPRASLSLTSYTFLDADLKNAALDHANLSGAELN
jgi:uncharacterized protein YjbI with pentapeptide repeats